MMGKWVFSAFFFALLMFVIAAESRAVDYELPDTNGQMQSMDQYKGKWLIVNYWATWCGLCMEEMPELIDFHKNNKVNAVVVGINFEQIETETLKDFVKTKTIPYAVLSTLPVKKTPLGLVPALPTTYIIDPDGKVVAGEIGMLTREQLESYIKQKES
ncbi:MAG: redoxin domain-containing protein [Gammaproteobacteria bacterium]|nr:redoxin domain-containing protein [Gammaproteobacteria bacterium]